MDVRLLHSRKASSPIILTEDGMSTEEREMQPSNALLYIAVTEFGMTIEVRSLQ